MHVSVPGRRGEQTRGQILESLNSCLPPLLSSPQMIRNMNVFNNRARDESTVYRSLTRDLQCLLYNCTHVSVYGVRAAYDS